jgi:hypothetical protein
VSNSTIGKKEPSRRGLVFLWNCASIIEGLAAWIVTSALGSLELIFPRKWSKGHGINFIDLRVQLAQNEKIIVNGEGITS